MPLAGQLVRQHHDFDAQRFMLIPNVEAGYAHFFASELSNPDVLLLAAEQAGSVVGYAYARLEAGTGTRCSTAAARCMTFS